MKPRSQKDEKKKMPEVCGETDERQRRPLRRADGSKTPVEANALPDLMRIKDCAFDGSTSTKTIRRWIDDELLPVWRPYPESRTIRVKRSVWEAFKRLQHSVRNSPLLSLNIHNKLNCRNYIRNRSAVNLYIA